MLNGEADRRASCSLLELSLPNKQQLQLESELAYWFTELLQFFRQNAVICYKNVLIFTL